MKMFRIEKYATLLLVLGAVVIISDRRVSADGGTERSIAEAQEVPDSTMKLQGGEEGTLFESLKIEGEDRIRIEFERPELILNLDPKSARGLEWQGIDDVLDNMDVSLIKPYLSHSAGIRRQCFARPWLNQFSSDGVARFQPNLKSVEKWRMMIANSKGETVAEFKGDGKPPKEIIWDGRSLDGRPVPPGLTYTYVLEAYDRAGNKKNFLGEGFELPSYRIETPEGLMMLFSASEVLGSHDLGPGEGGLPSAVLFDVINYVNLDGLAAASVNIEVTARSFEEADRLAGVFAGLLTPYLLGNKLRIHTKINVQPDAPDPGTVTILLPRS